MKEMTLPLLPLRSTPSILFPGASMQIGVGRSTSITAVRKAIVNGHRILVATQMDIEMENPKKAKLYQPATVATISRNTEIPKDGRKSFSVQLIGSARASLIRTRTDVDGDMIVGIYEQIPDQKDEEITEHLAELAMSLQSMAIGIQGTMSFKPSQRPKDAAGLSTFLDRLAYYVPLSISDKVDLLGTANVSERIEKLHIMLKRAAEDEAEEQIEIEAEPPPKYKKKDPDITDAEENRLRKMIDATDMPPEAKKAVEDELQRIGILQPHMADFAISVNYIEWMCSLPWFISTKDVININGAKKALDRDHYGLKKPKDRILEFLAVRKLRPDKKGSILCFSGPPGVGKTSLGKSIARAMGRKFIRMSVGSLHDEAEIRGHRRTYVGSMPGRIISYIRKAGSINPVFMLDEVDKMGTGSRRNPAAALLEVLDPEQNSSFTDNFLGVGFDLSQVLFIVTVNDPRVLDPALKDRMDMVEIPGYSIFDKVRIAKHYLIPKQKMENGLEDIDITLSMSAIERIIEEYTSETGVRSLERECGNILRKVAVRVAAGKETSSIIANIDVPILMGPPRIHAEKKNDKPEIGVATGLAWTPYGGSILFIESVSKKRGKGKVEVTGNLGDVMKESIKIVHSWIRSNTDQLAIDGDKMDKLDIHVHVPSGAIPKDGPSAGVAISTSMVSLLTGKPVRDDIAVTGEISLRGKVLPVGGIREKFLAAHRVGIRRVAIPEANKHDLVDLPKEVTEEMSVHLLKEVEQVIDLLLIDKTENREDTSINRRDSVVTA